MNDESINSKGIRMKIDVIHDIVCKNGKTIRQNNLAKVHKIPIGTLVEVKYDEWCGGGACQKVHARLWVVDHSRDCDGSPLYTLCNSRVSGFYHGSVYGLSEDQLTAIDVTKDIEDGCGALAWDS